MAAWRDRIDLVRNGESVDSRVTNRAVAQLAERTQYLKDRLDASAVGEGVILFSQPVSSGVLEGHAVFYDEDDSRYEPAVADVSNETGSLRTAASAYVIGVVIRKLTPTTADILVSGRYSGLTINDAEGSPLPEGRYYLSADAPGFLVSDRPAVGVFVCTVTTQGVVVQPTPREVLEDHIHHRFELKTDPAGFPLCGANDTVDIVGADESIEGWLPADHSVFAGTAPSGAFFGYNISANANLASQWPPHPVDSAYVEMDGLGVAPERVRIDENGIWWMANCASLLPWDAPLCESSSLALTEESSSSSAPVDPCGPVAKRVVLWFTRLVSQTAQAVVTGIKPADGSPVTVTGCAEISPEGYCRGPVQLGLALSWTRNQGVPGGEVVKGISGNDSLQTGYVVEGVRGSGLVSVAGGVDLGSGYRGGLITVTGADPSNLGRQLPVELVALNGATENVYSGIVPYVGLPADRETSFVGLIKIPDVSLLAPRLSLELWFATLSAGTPPADVTISYASVEPAQETAESSSSLIGSGFGSLPTAWSAESDLSLEDLGELGAGDYFGRTALTVDVVGGQLLLFRIKRSASDSYAGELAVVNMVGSLFEGG